MFKTRYLAPVLLLVLGLGACEKEYESIQTIDEAKIKDYVAKNFAGQTVLGEANSFRYIITNPGTGSPLLNKDSVFYDFEMKGLDGTLYQSKKKYNNVGNYVGYVTPIPFREVMLKLGRGGSAKIIIPSYMAFGKNGANDIPPNEIIVSALSILPHKTQWEIDDEHIAGFLTEKGITATKHSSRVYYQVIAPGTGTAPIDEHSTLVVNYTGRLLDGTVFDSGTGFSTAITSVIQGWGKILPMFTAGAKIRLFIPSDLAYGRGGSGKIPGNAVLDFDIEITTVTN